MCSCVIVGELRAGEKAFFAQVVVGALLAMPSRFDNWLRATLVAAKLNIDGVGVKQPS